LQTRARTPSKAPAVFLNDNVSPHWSVLVVLVPGTDSSGIYYPKLPAAHHNQTQIIEYRPNIVNDAPTCGMANTVNDTQLVVWQTQ